MQTADDGRPLIRLRVTVLCKGIYNSAARRKTTTASSGKLGRKSKKKQRTKDSYQFNVLFVSSENNRFIDLRRIE